MQARCAMMEGTSSAVTAEPACAASMQSAWSPTCGPSLTSPVSSAGSARTAGAALFWHHVAATRVSTRAPPEHGGGASRLGLSCTRAQSWDSSGAKGVMQTGWQLCTGPGSPDGAARLAADQPMPSTASFT